VNYANWQSGAERLALRAMALVLIALVGVGTLEAAVTWNGSADTSWSNASNWTGGEPTYTDEAIFPGTIPGSGSTINLSAGEYASLVRFYNNYTLTGGDLTIGTNGRGWVDSGYTATIASPLKSDANSHYFIKDGTGTLILTGDNTGFNEHTDVYSGILSIRAPNAVPGGYIHVNSYNRSAEIYGGITVPSNKRIYLSGTGTNPYGGALRSDGGDNVWLGGITLHGGVGQKDIGVDSGSLTLDQGIDDVSSTGLYTVRKVGNGTLILNGGLASGNWNTDVTAGVVRIRHNNAMGSAVGATTVADGTALEIENDIAVTTAGLTLNGSGISGTGVLRNNSGVNSWSSPVNLATNSTIGVDAGTLTLDGVISGNALAKVGAGTLVLSGASNYSGATTVADGTMQLSGGADRLPVGTALTLGAGSTGGTLDLNGLAQEVAGLAAAGSGTSRIVNSSATAASLTVNLATGAQTFGGILGNTGQDDFSLTKSGAGTLELAAANTYSGATTIDGGTLVLGDAAALGNTPGVTVNTGATLELNDFDTSKPVTLNQGTLSNSTGDVVYSGTLTLNGNGFVHSDQALSLSGKITGPGGFTKTGTRHIKIYNTANDYQGPTILETYWTDLYAADVLPSATDVTLNGHINMRGHSQTIRSLSGTSSASTIYGGGAATLTLGFDDGSGSWPGGLYDAASHNFVLRKIGTGTQTLTGDNSHNGNTIIEAGTLALSGAGALSESPLIDVQAGATFDVSGVTGGFALGSGQTLKGSGTVVGPITLASGSTHTPGDSAGVQTIVGDYTLDAGATLEMELEGPGQYDRLDVDSGEVHLAGTLDLVLGFDPGYSSFTLIDNDGADAVVGNFDGLPEGTTFTESFGSMAYSFTITYLGNDGNDVVLANVPEPATLLLAVLGVVGLAAYRRRLRRA